MIERFIRMLRGRKEPIPDDIETAFPSLVLLVNGEIPASKHFLQGAIEHVFGVTLDVDKDDSEQFISGPVPNFHLPNEWAIGATQIHARVLLQRKERQNSTRESSVRTIPN